MRPHSHGITSPRGPRPSLRLALPVLFSAALLAGCGSQGAPEAGSSPSTPDAGSPTTASASPAPEGSSTSPSTAHEEEWGYEGDIGPDRWGELPGAAACAKGRAQSPIDLTRARVEDLPDPQVAYRSGPLTIEHLDHTVQLPQRPGSFLTLDGKRYELKQIHHHTPGEHRVDGKDARGELHFVHTDAAGHVAVLGVRLVEGAANPVMAPVLDATPAETGATASPSGATLDPASLLPKDRRTYRYTGSLTTPPCTEGVKWSVFAAPLTMSAEQLNQLEALSGENNRPVQPLDGRRLLLDSHAS